MGNHKFRLSNMIPNAWFFKLKKISTTTNKNNNRSSPKEKSCPSSTLPAPFSSPTSTHKNSSSSDHLAPSSSSSSLSHSRKSYHFTRQLAQQNGNRHHPTSVKSPDSSLSNRPSVDSPRKSIRKSRRSHHSKRRSSTTSCSSTATTNSTATRYCSSSATTGCSCGGSSSTLTSSLQLKPDTCTATSDPNSTLQSSLNSPSHHLPAGDTTNHHTLLQSSSYDRVAAWSSSSTPTFDCDGRSDIVIEVDEKSLSLLEKKTEKAWSGPGVGLPPIKTDYNWKLNGTAAAAAASTREVVVDENKVKSRKSSSKYREKKANGASRLSVKVAAAEESVASSPATLPGSHRRFSAVGSPGGFRLRLNSPRIARRTTPGRKSVTNSSYSPSGGRGRGRKSISAESLAIVKSSLDPKRDFRDSMVEMIVENNIKASKDLEELLACYLSLNADEYHEVIINVFKQLWFDLNFINGFKARNANNIVNAKTSALKRR